MEFTQTFEGKIGSIIINKRENPGKNKMYLHLYIRLFIHSFYFDSKSNEVIQCTHHLDRRR